MNRQAGAVIVGLAVGAGSALILGSVGFAVGMAAAFMGEDEDE